jgi:hypothetical protein
MRKNSAKCSVQRTGRSSVPTPVPIGDERIIDIQMSVNYQENWNRYNPKPNDVLHAFERAGIKQRRNLMLDPNVPSDWIVLWVGPEKP